MEATSTTQTKSDSQPVLELVSHTREDPKIYPHKDFWSAYIADKSQFRLGEYVLYQGAKFLAKSDQPFPREYQCPEGDECTTQYIHKVANNDEEFYRHVMHLMSDKTLVLNNDLHAQLENIVKKLEQNGNFYQINIQEAYSGKTITIGDFNERSYIVYAMDEEYKELEGNYDTIELVRRKIQERELRELASEIKMITFLGTPILGWKCKMCQNWGKDGVPNTIDNHCCQQCRHSSSKVSQIRIDPAAGIIDVVTGGRFSFHKTIGYIKFK